MYHYSKPYLSVSQLIQKLACGGKVRRTSVRISDEAKKKAKSNFDLAFFSYIRLRRVLLLRSDIRLTSSGIRALTM